MIDNKLTILYLCIDENLGGSTQSLLNMIHSVQDNINPIVLLPRDGSAYKTFRNENIECYIYPFHKLYELKQNSVFDVISHPWRWHVIKKLRFDYGCWYFTKKILKGRNVDIVHSNTSPNDVGVLLAKKLKAKHVWHIREFCDLDFNFDIYRGIPRLRKLINDADARIAISTAIKTHWQLKDDKTWVINDAIRSVNDTCYIEKKEKYLLFCSYNLTEAKGTRNALIAFAKSGVSEQGFKLKLMGNCTNEYKESLLNTINDYKILKSVEFVHCQTDVKLFFERSTAYIMSSVFEGLGRVTAEAMFYGCPVIARASGGTLDMIRNGETGYLFTNEDECAEIIKKVCDSDQSKIIKNAQNFVTENLSQESYGPKIMNVYKTLLS